MINVEKIFKFDHLQELFHMFQMDQHLLARCDVDNLNVIIQFRFQCYSLESIHGHWHNIWIYFLVIKLHLVRHTTRAAIVKTFFL